MSSFIGGRSGNRGSCAQPCRMPYELVDDAGRPLAQEKGKYILSLKDMMGFPRIPDLLAAHVSSLKVEGRMKSAEYVYNTVSAYRKAIDAAKQHLLIDTEPLKLDLAVYDHGVRARKSRRRGRTCGKHRARCLCF